MTQSDRHNSNKHSLLLSRKCLIHNSCGTKCKLVYVEKFVLFQLYKIIRNYLWIESRALRRPDFRLEDTEAKIKIKRSNASKRRWSDWGVSVHCGSIKIFSLLLLLSYVSAFRRVTALRECVVVVRNHYVFSFRPESWIIQLKRWNIK